MNTKDVKRAIVGSKITEAAALIEQAYHICNDATPESQGLRTLTLILRDSINYVLGGLEILRKEAQK